MKKFLLLIFTVLLIMGCTKTLSEAAGYYPAPLVEKGLESIQLPAGFHIEYYMENVPGARSMVMSEKGVLFVGTRKLDKVYAVLDIDGDLKGDKLKIIAKGLTMPNGVALRDGNLYVAEVDKILRYDDIETNLENVPEPIVVNNNFPNKEWHGWKFIRFGPDGKLYVPVGAPCNVCEKEDPYGTIMRMNPDGTELEVYARGIRNTVGFDWDPKTKELWFTDNGRDGWGDDVPPDELNYAPQKRTSFWISLLSWQTNGR